MAYPLSAYYGRRTLAMLDECAYCHRPYHEAEKWHALKAEAPGVDAWFLCCGECYERTRVDKQGGRVMDVPRSAPFTRGLWCDGCRFFGIHGMRDGRIVDSVSYTCSRPELQRPPQEFRHISPGEIRKCYYREEVDG